MVQPQHPFYLVPHCVMFIRLEWWCDAGDETMSDQRFQRYDRFQFSTSFWVRSSSWWHRICICICLFCICLCGGGPFLLTWSKIFVVKMRRYWAVCLINFWEWYKYCDGGGDFIDEIETTTSLLDCMSWRFPLIATKTTDDQMFFVGSFTLDLGIGLYIKDLREP